MNKTVKILLIIFGLFILLSLAVCGGGYMWFESNKEAIKRDAEKLRTEATDFAKTNDQEACVVESLARLDRCNEEGALKSAMCRGMVNTFLNWCVKDAKETPDFCRDVPAYGEIMATVTWAIERCVKLGKEGNEQCTQLISKLAQYCSERSKS